MEDAGRLKFETIVFAESPNAREEPISQPTASEALFVAGIPKSFFGDRYRADAELTLVAASDEHSSAMRFGTTSSMSAICVELDSGSVIHIAHPPEGPTILVNATLGTFTETVRSLIGRFPYYSRGASRSQIDLVGKELRELIRSIDPEASAPG